MKMYIVCHGTPSPRAVLIGESETRPVVGEPCTLHNARMVIFWSKECGGLLGLAANGPRTSTRISAPVPTYTCIAKEVGDMTDAAAEGVRQWPAA